MSKEIFCERCRHFQLPVNKRVCTGRLAYQERSWRTPVYSDVKIDADREDILIPQRELDCFAFEEL